MTSSSNGDPSLGLLAQAWPSLAAWIAFGLLVEGFAGWRVPAVMDDHIRREMFRLAHAHGTLLNLLLVAAALCARLGLLHAPRAAVWALRAAVLAMPLGFLLGGAWHPSVDPGPGVWLVPPAAVLLLWFAVAAALSRPVVVVAEPEATAPPKERRRKD